MHHQTAGLTAEARRCIENGRRNLFVPNAHVSRLILRGQR